MAKKNKIDKWETQHRRNLRAYERQIEEIYLEAVREAASIGGIIGNFSPDKPFSFSDYPITQHRVEKLLKQLENSLFVAIVNGVRSEWTLANNKNNELCNQVFGDAVGFLTEAQYRQYYSTNSRAEEAFLARKDNGLNLSDRVWNYTEQFKKEIEMGLDLGLRDGLSADEMSRQLRQFLVHPDKLFRRVRDEHGVLHLSKAAKAFHPGRGVYRSSYKNARRLAATETNMAYRTADHDRWQQLDFVVGIEVKLSNNHPVPDICDELKGRYPKDFKYVGWHPHCRCYVVSILKTREEMMRDNERILAGEPISTESVNTVKDVPQGFKDWADANLERAERSYSVPYFVSDNLKYLPKGYAESYGVRMPYGTYAEYQKAMKYNAKHAHFTPAVRSNNYALSRVLPVMQGKIMSFKEADGGRANPSFADTDAVARGFYHNCQTCTMAYELRRRGFFVRARPNPVVKTSGGKEVRDFDRYCTREKVNWMDRFLNADGTRAQYEWSAWKGLTDTIKSKQAFIEGAIKEQGRYEVYCAWKGGSAHVFTIERQADGNLLWFDPQSGKHGGAGTFEDFIKKMKAESIGVMRIDDKIINPKFASRLLRSSE